MQICIVAENASTRFGGEAILPFHYFRVLRARGMQAWMVVHSRTRDELQALFPDEQDRILYVEELPIQASLFKLSRFLPRRVGEATIGLASQLLTQLQQRNIVRRLVREHGITVVHQPIPVSPRLPSLLCELGAPVIIGPLNGGMDYPQGFRNVESRLTRLFVAFSRLLSNAANRILPGKRLAEVVLVANQRTHQALPSGVRGRIIEMVENGVDLKIWSDFGSEQLPQQNRFMFLGRLVDWKAVNLAIEAVALVPGAELEIIGDGPMRLEWTALAERLGLSERVHFLGWLPQQECAEHLRSAIALLLPSIYECGGAVVLEAMAMGRPVVAAQWGGPADCLDPACGILIPTDSPQSMIGNFAAAMKLLMDSPALCRRMGSIGREKALRDFDWEKKVDHMLLIYASAAGNSSDVAGTSAIRS